MTTGHARSSLLSGPSKIKAVRRFGVRPIDRAPASLPISSHHAPAALITTLALSRSFAVCTSPAITGSFQTCHLCVGDEFTITTSKAFEKPLMDGMHVHIHRLGFKNRGRKVLIP